MADEPRPTDGAEEPSGTESAEPSARPVRDPWKGLRGVMAGTLIIEAIVVALALPVIAKLGNGGSGVSGTAFVVVIVLAVAMVVASGLLRTGWGLPLALVLQVVMIGTGVFQFTLGVLGVMFALIWGYILYLRHDLMKHLERGDDKYTGGAAE